MSRGPTAGFAELSGLEEHAKPSYADDPRWLLVERILATREFRRSQRLSEFLRHICELTLEGREDTISEQYLGITLFGRAPDYDSSADTIVRSHALRLRSKLESYFRRDGKAETLQLVIPRGGYIPHFVPASQLSVASLAVAEELSLVSEMDTGGSTRPLIDAEVFRGTHSEAPDSSASFRTHVVLARYRAVLSLAACFVLALVAIIVYQWHALAALRAHEYHDRNHLLWGRLFNATEPTQIVLGDSGLVLFHATSRQYVSLQDYVNNDLSKQLRYVEHVEPKFALFLAGRRYTSHVDAATAVRLMRLPEARPDRTIVNFSRDMHLDDFKNGNIIILGAQEADPWDELFEHSMDFAFSIDTPDQRSVFVNRHPLPGEQAVYRPEHDGPHQLYAVIAFLPNLTGTGNVLLLEGISMAGTESAVDLVMDDQRLLPILNKIRRADGTLPHFEMVIATNVVKDSPTPAQVVALHVHDAAIPGK